MSFADYINRSVGTLRNFIPLLLLLKGRGMQQTHLSIINKEFGNNLQMKETTLRELNRLNLHTGPKLDFVRTIADMAQKEYSIKVTLDQIDSDLNSCFIKHMSFQRSYLLAEIDSDILVMKECQLKAFSISGSSYAKGNLREQIEKISKQLKLMIKFFL